jgi:hypothetical protein
MRDNAESIREIGKAIAGRMAQPDEDAKAEEEVEQPETDLVESEEQTEEVEEETEEAEAEESEEGEESEDQEETELHEVKHNGEIQKVDYEELQKLASAGFDYTKKTQELAERVKTETDKKVLESTAELAKERQDLVETTTLLEQFIGKPTVTEEQMNVMLAEGDTEGYLKAQQQDKQRQAVLDGLKAKRTEIQQKQQAEAQQKFEVYSKQQAEVLMTKVPELKDPKKLEALVDYARSIGYTDEELKTAADARALEALDKARKWDEMISKGIKPKPKSKSPKVTKKAGSNIPRSAQQTKTVKDRQSVFGKSGSMRDFGKLYSAKLAGKKG